MKLKITLTSDRRIKLPKGFNYLQQGLIYNLLDQATSKWLHDTGYIFEKRKFKHFTYSSFIEKGKYSKERGIFTFPEQISFYLSSPVKKFLTQIALNSAKRNNLKLGENNLQLSSIEIIKNEIENERKVRVKTITPVEVHSTPPGEKKQQSYSPSDKEFSQLLNKNMMKKWCAINNKETCPFTINIYPVRLDKIKLKVGWFKKTKIDAWEGHFWLEGDQELVNLALDSGIGSRNSAGFGMIQTITNNQ